MQTGQFFPTFNYTNDISLTFDGTHKIYPSRYAIFNSGLDIDKVKDIIETAKEYSMHNPDDYNPVRYSIFRNPAQPNKWPTIDISTQNITTGQYNPQNIPNFGRLVGVGDINFLSHDTYDGMIYTEVYVNVSPEDLEKCIIMHSENSEDLCPGNNESIFTVKDPNKTNPGLEGNTATFDVVVLFYNIYSTSADATEETEAIAVDLPMGIYILNEPQSLIVESDTIYGAGTSWATRICSRLVSTALLNQSLGITQKETDYNTLAKILTEFGKISSDVSQLINRQNDNLQTIKSYLQEFKNHRSINVPYIIGNQWYVNGKNIGSIIPDSTPINEFIVDYLEENGTGIKSIKMQYALTVDETTIPSDWNDDPQVINKNYPYLWTKLVIEYINGTIQETQPVISGIYQTMQIIRP